MKWNLKVFAAATVLVAAASFQLAGQISKGKSRPLETKIWMKSVNGPFCTNLGKILKAGPADDKAWADVVLNAQMLSEAGHVLMADGRCPDKAWADASKQLQEGADAVLKAAGDKNTEAAMNAFNNSVLASCKGCHSVHRMKK
jgi:cytochrome c556